MLIVVKKVRDILKMWKSTKLVIRFTLPVKSKNFVAGSRVTLKGE